MLAAVIQRREHLAVQNVQRLVNTGTGIAVKVVRLVLTVLGTDLSIHVRAIRQRLAAVRQAVHVATGTMYRQVVGLIIM